MLASLVLFFLLPFVFSTIVWAGPATNVTSGLYSGKQGQRQLTEEDIDQLRKVALDLPLCGAVRALDEGAIIVSSPISDRFSSGVREYNSGRNAADPDGHKGV